MTPATGPWNIAIIGMACRFPGAAHPRTFWDNLVRGVESITFFSDEELRAAGEDAALLSHPHYVKAAPVLEDHYAFDAAFFGYSQREARLMDPQQRLFLEVAWEAFEDAGYDPRGPKGRVGVYAGAGGLVSSYLVRVDHPDLRGQTGDLGHLGNDRDFLCSRVSFKLDLTGPSVNVQSACSTSLLAVHLACRGLLDGEADLALAGAAVVRVPHLRGYLAEPGSIYSRDGHCRPFDAGATGTLFGSGVGAVLLRPLEAALASGDHVYAVIKGAAVNNDGAQKVSYTASTATGQTRAAREAMTIARVASDSIGYVECHGTATTLGDPVEIQALTRAFGPGGPRAGACAIGSVKSNVGHLEQCAGMAGLIKAALVLRHGVIPPSLHFDTPNPRILLERSPFTVNTRARPFEWAVGPRRVGVNSVGMGGTNAFVVLEEAPPRAPTPPRARPVSILTMSAGTEAALLDQVGKVRDALASDDSLALPDVCFSANRGRHHFARRFAGIGRDRDEMLAELERFLQTPRPPGGAVEAGSRGPVVFLFSGQGSQYARMGEATYRAEARFRDAMDRCFSLFLAAGIQVAETLFADDEPRLHRTQYAQPALFSLQVALVELWRSWGVTPDVVIGHSVGEFAAAVTAGVCSLEDAVRLVSTRARLMEDLAPDGGMVSIGSDLETVLAAWPDGREDLTLAAINAPDRVVASGSVTALTLLADRLRERDVPVAALATSHAFHSSLMDPMLERFEEFAATVAFERPRTRWISTLTGCEMSGPPDADYWRDQIRSPVQFRAAIEIVARDPAAFVEIGPGGTLTGLARRCVKAPDVRTASAWLSSLTRDGDEWSSLLEAVRHLYLRGHPIDWHALEGESGRRVSLPTSTFRRQRWWLAPRRTPRAAPVPADSASAHGPHPLLGERLGNGGSHFEVLIDLDQLAFLRDHRVFGRVVLPTTAILETVTAAAIETLGFSRPVVRNFLYEAALTIPADEPVWIHLDLEPSGSRAAFRVQSTGLAESAPWQLNVTGSVEDDLDPADPTPFQPRPGGSITREIPPDHFYRVLDAAGLSYGPIFQGIRGLWRHADEAWARVALPVDIPAERYRLHPAYLDACLHVYAAFVPEYGGFDHETPGEVRPYVPISMDSFHLFSSGVRAGLVHAVLAPREGEDEQRLTCDIHAYGEDGSPVALFRGLTIRGVTEEVMMSPRGDAPLPPVLYRLTWREVPRPRDPRVLARHWCVLDDETGVGARLAEHLRAEGCAAHVISAESLEVDSACLIEAASFETLLQHLGDESVGIVYLWTLKTPAADLSADSVSATTYPFAAGACVGLLKALDRRRALSHRPPRVWGVTRGAQPGAHNSTGEGLTQSTLWGLARTAALEYPDLWGGLIDLPPLADAETAARLLFEEFRSGGDENQIALRPDARLAPRLVRLPAEPSPPRRRLRPDATYWITGGLGVLGLEIARALVEAGARHLLLTGRHAPSPSATATLSALGQQVELVILPSDVSRQADVEATLVHIRERMPPLKGVIHAAAVFDDAVIENITWEQLDCVSRPKIAGAWRLSQATSGLPLDFFVLFSSVLSLWGAAGQATYTAANGFLDSLAASRRAAGLPAAVFNWGPWAHRALAGRWGPAGARAWKQRGTSPLNTTVCLDVLLRFLDGEASPLAICDTDWGTFLAQFPSVPPLFRDLAPTLPGPSAAEEVAENSPSLVDTVRRHVSRVLGEDRVISVTQPLNQLGLDSLLAVTLANRLRDSLKVAVPTAMLLKGYSIADLVAELFPDAPPPAPVPLSGPAPRTAGDGWLIMHRPDPTAAMRLFCFPFAGGGAATFRPWVQNLDPRVELVAIEPPGRQTRIDEPPIRDLQTFVQQLVPRLLPFLDKPFAVYGHCLGALTLFETVRTLIRAHGLAPVHVFVSGARPPDELHRPQDFETALLEKLLKLPGYSLFAPIHQQPDEVFSTAMLEFNVVATEDLLANSELRRLIMPVIRAEFEMSSKYRFVPEEPWDVAITCLTGTRDLYVSAANARGWSRFTKRRFQLLLVDTEHFLVVDEDELVLRVLNRELAHPL